MASIPQFYTDYVFSPDIEEPEPPLIDSSLIWDTEENFPFPGNGQQILDLVQSPESDISSSALTTALPERLALPYIGVPTMPDFNMSLCNANGIQNFGVAGAGFEYCMPEFGKEYSGFTSDVQQVYAAGNNCWGVQANSVIAVDEPNVKVRRYSVEERKDRIMRYLKKRNQRNFDKTIKYACRKTLADRRVRVRGRFARNNESCEECKLMNYNGSRSEKELYDSDNNLIKSEEDEWLQETIASLMYLPYVTG